MKTEINPQTTIQRYAVGDCEMLPSKAGSYVKVSDVRAMLNDITDDDHVDVMLLKIQAALVNLS